MNPNRLQTYTKPLIPFTFAPLTQASWSELAREAQYQPQAVAQLCCVSYRTVQRHFRKHYKSTFTDWLSQLRMQEARNKILAGAQVKQVCFDLGYKQPSHFTRVFKKHYGFPPSFLSVSQQRHLPLFAN